MLDAWQWKLVQRHVFAHQSRMRRGSSCLTVLPVNPGLHALVLQGLIFTAGAAWNVLQKLNIPIDVVQVSAPLSPLFGRCN